MGKVVLPVTGHRGGAGAHRTLVAATRGDGGEIPQAREAAGVDHLPGRLLRGRQHADDLPAAFRVAHRAEGEREVGLLQVAVPEHQQSLVLRPGGAPAGHHLVEQRPREVPDLGPDLAERPAEGIGMLTAEDGDGGLVVEVGQLRTPGDHHREARLQAQADAGAQAHAPRVGRPEGRGPPVPGRHQPAHLATGRKRRTQSAVTHRDGAVPPRAHRHAPPWWPTRVPVFVAVRPLPSPTGPLAAHSPHGGADRSPRRLVPVRGAQARGGGAATRHRQRSCPDRPGLSTLARSLPRYCRRRQRQTRPALRHVRSPPAGAGRPVDLTSSPP